MHQLQPYRVVWLSLSYFGIRSSGTIGAGNAQQVVENPVTPQQADILALTYWLNIKNVIMPTIFTHAVIPLAVGIGLGSTRVPKPLLIAGVIGAMLPDLDVVAFKFGIAYADAFGHRGASHSLVFAMLMGLLAALCATHLRAGRLAAFLFITMSVFSHGVLDAFTDGGLGPALWWPFSDERIFAPWRVIEVSPIGISRFISERGLVVLLSEFKWVWLPAIALCGVVLLLRRTVSRVRERSINS